MNTFVVVAGVVVAILIMAGSLLLPVPKRWNRPAAWVPFGRRRSVRQRWRERRPLLLVLLGLAAVAAVVLAIWVLPAVLTRHPQLETAAEQHKASADARAGWVAMLVAIGAAGGLAFTARTYRLSREGHITDRYSKAVEQLGSDKIEVRIGGIYAPGTADAGQLTGSADDHGNPCRLRPPTRSDPSATRRRDRRVAGDHRALARLHVGSGSPGSSSSYRSTPLAPSRPPGACRLMDGREKLLHVEAERRRGV